MSQFVRNPPPSRRSLVARDITRWLSSNWPPFWSSWKPFSFSNWWAFENSFHSRNWVWLNFVDNSVLAFNCSCSAFWWVEERVNCLLLNSFFFFQNNTDLHQNLSSQTLLAPNWPHHGDHVDHEHFARSLWIPVDQGSSLAARCLGLASSEWGGSESTSFTNSSGLVLRTTTTALFTHEKRFHAIASVQFVHHGPGPLQSVTSNTVLSVQRE